MRAWLSASLLLMLAAASAQPTAAIIGRVIDADTEQPLPGATVEVLLPDSAFGTVTDERGAFRFGALPAGVHALLARFNGYAPTRVQEAWARTGRSEELTIALSRDPRTLEVFEVSGAAFERGRMRDGHPLTVEQTLRYPATFLDPARLASTRPGVATVNDQANHLSIRGNGPASNAYLLEGAEIVCPNHLTNAGTASDLPTLTGGGVTILSAQMLGPSRLLTGSLDAAYGNALGGILDMRLRRGSTDRRGYTVQAGLLGIDLSAEGPFRTGARSTYLINYRYSTIGLLGAMGIDLGDEAITFQDLSFHVAVPVGRGSLSLFGLGGISENHHAVVDDTSAREFDKDSQDIRYTGSMGAAGITLALPLGHKGHWRTTMIASENDQSRDSETYDASQTAIARSASALRERKLSAITRLGGRIGEFVSYEAGASAMERTVTKELLLAETTASWLVRPFAQAGIELGARWQLEIGAAYANSTTGGYGVWEPRGSIAFAASERTAVSLFAGQRSQLPAVQLYYLQPSGNFWNNSPIGLDRMQEAVLAVEHAARPHLRIRAEAFVQQRFDVPIGDATRWVPPFNDDGSMVNAWDQPLVLDLRAQGEARNTGAEASLLHDMRNGRYVQFNATAFQSTYTDSEGRERESRWSRRFVVNAIAGREFTKQTEQRVRGWGLNIRAVVAGGLRSSPIDTLMSGAVGGTVFDPSQPFRQQQAAYHRIDLRVYLKREHARRSGQWSLDLQNVLNTRNEAYRYFDHRKGGVVAQEQLGLIPNLSYRIEF